MHDTNERIERGIARAAEQGTSTVHGVAIPGHTATAQRLAMELDERRRPHADKIVRQYERGLLSVEDLAMEIVCIIGEVQ